MIESIHNGFIVPESSRPEIATYLVFKITPSLQPVADQEPFHCQPFCNHVEEIGRARPRFFIVVTGDAATGDNPAMNPQSCAYDPNFVTAYVHSWFVGVQRELRPRWILEADYTGSAGHKLYNSVNVNRYTGDLLDGVFSRFGS